MNWKVLDTGKAPPMKNMELDLELLEKGEREPILHFYEWDRPSATYGYFIDPFQFLCRKGVEQQGLNLARRPTGGGITFHVSDFAFSAIVPVGHPAYSLNVMENYAFVNDLVKQAVSQFMGEETPVQLLPSEVTCSDPASRNFCMAKPTKYDVMYQGRKVGGGAQRRTRQAFLHQGTIAVALPTEDFLRNVLLPESSVFENMLNHSFYLLPSPYTASQIKEAQQLLKKLMVSVVDQLEIKSVQ